MYSLGIDIGTTAVKGLLISDNRIVAEASAEHALISLHPGWAEENPNDWYQNTLTVIRQILAIWQINPRDIAALGFSGMVPAIVFLDKQGQVLRRSIQQNDARTTTEIARLKEQIDQQVGYARTGSYTNQQHVGPRVAWVSTHEPDVWQQTAHLCGSYDYLAYRFTGNLSLELNWAVESGLFDIHTQTWIPEYLNYCGIELSQLPPVKSPTDIIGRVTAEIATLTGLLAGTPVIAGSADHVASALAAGLREDGDLLIKFGGAGDVLYATRTLRTHPKLYIDFHDIPGQFLINGCMAASGSLAKWYLTDILRLTTDPRVLQQLDQEANEIPPGSNGLIILPYFIGEKTPLFDSSARGVFFGLSLAHTRAHIFRAILEAVIYGFRHHVEELETMNFPVKRILATNGGVKSQIWRQIAADVLGKPIKSFPGHPGSALGVAFVAAHAVGMVKDWNEIEVFLKVTHQEQPIQANQAIYEQAYQVYRKIYIDLKDDFPLLTNIGG